MVVNKTNLYSEAWKTIRDFLKANLTDPVTNSKSSTRKWVYNREPLPGEKFKGLPFIQVSDLTIPDVSKSFSKGTVFHKLRMVITIKSDEDKNTGEVPELDDLSDELNQAVKDETSLSNAGIKNVRLTDVGTDDAVFNKQPVRIRTFTIEADLPVFYG